MCYQQPLSIQSARQTSRGSSLIALTRHIRPYHLWEMKSYIKNAYGRFLFLEMRTGPAADSEVPNTILNPDMAEFLSIALSGPYTGHFRNIEAP